MGLEEHVRNAKTQYDRRHLEEERKRERELAEAEARRTAERFAEEAEEKFIRNRALQNLQAKRYRVYAGDWIHAWAIKRELTAEVFWVYVGDFTWNGSSLVYGGVATGGSTCRGKGLEYFPDWDLTVPTGLISDFEMAFDVNTRPVSTSGGGGGGSNRSW